MEETMLKQKRPLLGLIILVFVLLALSGQKTVSANTSWHAEYYNNRNLSGSPVFSNYVDKIFFDWGDASPNEAVNSDDFSATYNGNVYFDHAGVYRFVATTDDGMRVFINNNPIIDVWYDSQAHTVTTDVYLEAGTHPIRVEYYEATGGAVAQLSWYPATAITNWRGEYYKNRNLENQPSLVRDDVAVNFEWGLGSPAAGTIPDDDFSVRWTRTVPFNSGTYRFTVTTDDGARLWVNNQLIIDAWFDQTVTTYTADIYIPGGNVPIKMEYYDSKDNATAKLNWTAVSTGSVQPSPISPTAVNWDAAYYNNFSLSGTPAMTRIDSNIHFTWGSSSPQPNLVNADNFSVRWSKNINFAPGTYTFQTTVEGGARLFVNGELVIDQWQPEYKVVQGSTNVTLPGGSVPVVLEFRKDKGLAQAWLDWQVAGSGGSSTTAVTSSTSSSASAPVPELSGNTAAMTGARHLTVRDEPSLDGEAVGYLSNGEVVTLLGRDIFTIWIEIQRADGTTGWVSGRFLTTNVPLDSLPVTN